MNLTVRSYNGKSKGRVNPKQAGKSLKKISSGLFYIILKNHKLTSQIVKCNMPNYFVFTVFEINFSTRSSTRKPFFQI